jgi:hypothetical protein
VRMGDRFYSGFLVFSKSKSAGLILETVSLRPGIVVSIDKNQHEQSACKFRPPRVNRYTDNSIIIKRPGAAPTLIDRLYSTNPDFFFGYCTSDSIAD